MNPGTREEGEEVMETTATKAARRFRVFPVFPHVALGPWKYKVRDTDEGRDCSFHVEREDAASVAAQLNETGYVDVERAEEEGH
jgi:hypothetical protein